MAAELFKPRGLVDIPEVGQCEIVSWSETVLARLGSERSIFIVYFQPFSDEIKTIEIHLFKTSDPASSEPS
jgi:hypothetical protein